MVPAARWRMELCLKFGKRLHSFTSSHRSACLSPRDTVVSQPETQSVPSLNRLQASSLNRLASVSAPFDYQVNMLFILAFHHYSKDRQRAKCILGQHDSQNICTVLSVTRRSRSDVSESVTHWSLADFNDVTLVSEDVLGKTSIENEGFNSGIARIT